MLKRLATKNNCLLISITLFLFSLPFLWTSGEMYNLGGDDSRLYLYAPEEFAKNTALYSWFGLAFGSYNPQQFFLSFNALGTALNHLFPFANLQKVIYALIFSVGFLAVYLLIHEISGLKKADDFSFYPSVIGGLSYTFFPLVFWFWDNPLYMEITGFAAYPLLLLFFFKAVNTKKIKYLLFGSVLGTIFATATLPGPNFYALLLGVFIFLLAYLLLFKEKRVLVIKYSILYAVIFLVLNLFWVLPWLLSNPEQRVVDTSGASRLVEYLAPRMSLHHTLLGLPSPWVNNNAHLLMFAPLSVLLPLGLFSASLLRPPDSSLSHLKKIWISLVIATLTLAYFQTVSIGDLGTGFFKWLTENVPGWVMFRNFFRRFPQAYALFYSLTLGISLYIISKHPGKSGTRRKLSLRLPFKKIIPVSIIMIVLLQGLPLMKGDVINQPIAAEGDMSITRNVKIPQYYTDTVNYVEGLEEGRILSLPLLSGNWFFFSSERENGVYIGASPIRFLTGRYHITGAVDLRASEVRPLGPVVENAILVKDYLTLKNFLSLSSVKYIIYNHEAFSILSPQKVGDIESIWGYNKFQTEESIRKIIKVMSAEKIENFGPISIYEIPDEYYYPFIYVTEELAYFGGSVESFLRLPIHNNISKYAFYLGNDRSVLEKVTAAFIYVKYTGEGDRYDIWIPKEGIYSIYEDSGNNLDSFDSRFVKIEERAFKPGSYGLILSRPTVVTEDFSSPSDRWENTLYGKWIVENGMYTPIEWRYNWAISTYNEIFQNAQIEAKVRPNGNYIYLMFRYLDDNNFYEFGLDPDGVIALVKFENGQRIVLGANRITLEIEKWYNIKVIFNDGNIECYVDNEKLIDTFDSNNLRQGKIGIKGTGKVYIDFINIYPSPPRGYLLHSDFMHGEIKKSPSLNFQKISPVEYKVDIANAKNPFFLVLSDSYHSAWRVYSGEISGFRALVTSPVETDHFLVNGYANAWYIDPNEIDKDGDGKFTITLYFWPQSLFYLGLLISGFTSIGSLTYTVIVWKRNKRERSKNNENH